MNPLDRALAWLVGQADSMESLLAELVELSSHTCDAAGVTAVAERLHEALVALSRGALGGELVPSSSGRFGAHLALSSRAARSGGALLLIGHHDTVFPRATFSGFRVDGPLLRGPGVLDMKGGLVVMAYALAALAASDRLNDLPVRVISVSDEEVGSPEGKEVISARAADARLALVFESGRAHDQIITQRKGTGGITVRAQGKAAHAGNLHQEGKNAIWALARFIDGAQQLTDYDRGLTVNVGLVRGGIGKNTVPAEAEALLDFRFTSEADGHALVQRLETLAVTVAAELPGTSITLEGGIARLPLKRTPASAQLAAEYGACARASQLGSEEAPLLGGGSDANTAAALGLPVLDGLGPRGRGFHTVDEQVERATLVPKAAALTRFLYQQL